MCCFSLDFCALPSPICSMNHKTLILFFYSSGTFRNYFHQDLLFHWSTFFYFLKLIFKISFRKNHEIHVLNGYHHLLSIFRHRFSFLRYFSSFWCLLYLSHCCLLHFFYPFAGVFASWKNRI